jgi:hypothetical protein
LLLSSTAIAADGPPGSNIYLADLTTNKTQTLKLSAIDKITNHQGYDNQPYFLPDGSGLLYTSMLQMKDGQWQADSIEYNFSTHKHTNLTQSNISEYSPTLMAGGKYFSSVVVEKSNKQHLWAYPLHNNKKAFRLSKVEPVGYHAWGEKGNLAMFVLGNETTKHTLQYQHNFKTKPKVVAQDIGRSLRYMPIRKSFTFSQIKDDGSQWLNEYQPETDKVTVLVQLPKGSDYYTWVNEDTAVTATGTTLYLWHKQKMPNKSANGWVTWKNLASVCSTKITRLAVNKQQSKLAFVCDE